MSWAEFRQWVWDEFGEWHESIAHSTIRRALFGRLAVNDAGSGHGFEYEAVHQRRVAFWMRSRDLLVRVEDWLDVAEDYVDGWLVNDGSGIRWVADPAGEVVDLARRGFVGVRCGL